MSDKDIEKWVLDRGFFADCRKCPERKEGCHKNCKFFESYKRKTRAKDDNT